MIETDNNIFDRIDPDDNLLGEIFQSMNVQRQSRYYTVDEFNNTYSDCTKFFSLCNFNIRSFNCNSEIFFSHVNSLCIDFDVYILTETRFSNDLKRDLSGFTAHHSVRNDGGGGGVSVYCVDKLLSSRIDNLCFVTENIESCVVKVKVSGRIVYLVAIYRPPQGNIECFMENLQFVMNSVDGGKSEVIVTGDINIDILNYENACVSIKNVVYYLHSLNFFPVITKPTRFPSGDQHGTPSLLDHIWYNRFVDHQSGILLFNSTDHEPTFLIVNDMIVNPNELVRTEFRIHSQDNIDFFVSECSKLNLRFSECDVDQYILKFDDAINNLYRRCFPVKVKYVSKKRLNKPWLTSSLFNQIKTKSKYYKMFKLGTISEIFYKRYRNNLTNTLRNEKKNYYKNAFLRSNNNMKSTWSLIRSLISDGKSNETIKEMVVDGVQTGDGLCIAEKFNQYFSEVALKLQHDIPVPCVIL